MLRRWRAPAGQRLGLFESVRQFAVAHGDSALVEAQARHAQWAMDYVVERTSRIQTSPSAHAELFAEVDNLVCAARWLISTNSSHSVDILTGLFPLFQARRMPNVLPDLLRRARSEVSLTAHQSAQVNHELAFVYDLIGQRDAALIEVNAGLARVSHADPIRAGLLQCAVVGDLGLGDSKRALEGARYAVDQARTHGWGIELVRLLNTLGGTLQHLRSMDEAVACYREALELCVDHRADRFAGTVWRNLGGCLSQMGQLEEALACFVQAKEVVERFDDPAGLHAIRGGLAATYGRLGQFDKADQLFTELIATDERLGGRVLPGVIRLNAGIAALLVGGIRRARDLLLESHRRNQSMGMRGGIDRFCLAYLLVSLAALGQLDAADAARAQLAQLSDDDLTASERVEVALCEAHVDLARARAPASDPQTEERISAQVRALLESADPEHPDTAVGVALLRAAIDRTLVKTA